MPFEKQGARPRRIAVVGAGISGMAAAHLLSREHAVVLYEAEGRLGGHARTVLAGKRGDQPVDTGFIVFNHANYPYLTALFHDLGVPVAQSRMTFGASVRGGAVEYGLDSLDTLFAQRRNAADPRFLRMLADIIKFNNQALALSREPGLTIGGLMDRLRVGRWFRDYYLLPFSGAIWSTPCEKILDFPAHAMLRFFENHALLSYSGQHQWYTVQGGSVEYVRRLGAAMFRQGVDIRLGAPIAGVRRTPDLVEVRAHGGDWEPYDDVVFATHSDDTLALLSDASPEERAALGAVGYQSNHVVLHADAAQMPRNRKCWSSWVYVEDEAGPSDRIGLTYWMNSLQPIPHDDPLFVTLNATRPIREDLIHSEVTFRHPIYDTAALAAQGAVRAMNGTRNTWFCGAWMKNGFHEDGLASAVDVVDAMALRSSVGIAAE